MQEGPIPLDEERRIALLHSLGILDTAPEERFDRITRLASALFDAPIALVSLVDVNRQWFKSCIGLPTSETDRSVSFCAHALERHDALVIEDALLDPRFADNPLVTEDPRIRFYAGFPLRVGGDGAGRSAVGTLCVIDRQPRPFGERERGLLADLAHLVEQELGSVELARATAALAASEARVAGILGSVAEGVATFALDATVLSFNPAAEGMFGWSEPEIVGRPITDLVFPDDVPTVLGLLAERAASDAGEEVHVTVRGLRRDGTDFEMEVSASELQGSAGQVFIAVARDISHRREVERLKDQFVSIVSHELRTPLTSIQGSLGLVAGGVLGEIPPEPKEMIDVALANTTRLARLVNDILDLERIATGHLDLTIVPCDGADLVRAAVESTAGAADAAGVRIDVDAPSTPLAADCDRVVQALTNLIGNAVKFSPAGSAVQVGIDTSEDAVTFRVHDRGRGIPEEKLESVFERFQQVDIGDRRDKGGTGLGLPITRSIARQHGGDVTVDSELGVGSTFRLVLPRSAGG